MIYSTLTSPKFRPLIKALVLLLITSFSSCMTVENRDYTPDEYVAVKDSADLEIKNIYTKSDSLITISDGIEVSYHPKYKNLGDIFLINSIDTILMKNSAAKSYVVKNKNSIMKLKDIKYINTKKSEVDVNSTIFISAGFVAVATAVIVGLCVLSSWKRSNDKFWEAFRQVYH